VDHGYLGRLCLWLLPEVPRRPGLWRQRLHPLPLPRCGLMKVDWSEPGSVGPARQFQDLATNNRNDQSSGPDREQILQPDTMVTSGDQK
jgi:hypothetical protein